jgi:gentisate 1,2-dioxygenase
MGNYMSSNSSNSSSTPSNSPFIDATDNKHIAPELWEPIIISKEQIDAEIERLASLPKPDNGRRRSYMVHPCATKPGLGLAAGITVSLDVLLPGESTAPIRHNSTQINFCIHGSGYTTVNNNRIDFNQYDVWNHNSFATYTHYNNSDEIQVRLTYSNAALLEKMQVHIVEENPIQTDSELDKNEDKDDPRRKSPYGSFQLTDEGAWMMPYEILINPPSVESKNLHWPWQKVKNNLDKLTALGKDYIGRRLYLLYNPMTGRTNGTTPNFFATMTVRPPKIIDRPHRHVSAAINYYFQGTGYSIVEKKRYEWKAGDLMLSAPGWAIHNHASYDEPVYELTVQDQSLNINMESLLWQESLDKPAVILGQQSGFSTNRTE